MHLFYTLIVMALFSECRGQEMSKKSAVITWEIKREIITGKVSGIAATGSVYYYWDDVNLGKNRIGLEKLYERIKKFTGSEIIYHSRSRNEPSAINDPFFNPKTFLHFTSLFRSKNLDFKIIYIDDENFRFHPPRKNPFSK